MFGFLKKPRFSNRELLIIKECCTQCFKAIRDSNPKKAEIKGLLSDIQQIIEKIKINE